MSAPNANKLFTALEIANWIRDLITSWLATELGISATQGQIRVGSFAEITAGAIKDVIPAVIVMPTRVENNWGDVDGEDYITTYKFRIVYVSAITTGAQRETQRMKGQRIADLLAANVGMNNPTVPGVYQNEGIYCKVTGIEFHPEEDDFVEMINADYYAVAVECDCQRHTFTSN